VPVRERIVWRPVTDAAFQAQIKGSDLSLVAAGPDGVVAVAACANYKECFHVLTSRNGQTWKVQPHTLAGYPVDITYGSGGFVIPALVHHSHVVYVSADGRKWDSASLNGESPGDGLNAVIGTPDGYLLLGCAGGTAARDGHLVGRSGTGGLAVDILTDCAMGKLWRSSDGHRWKPQNPGGTKGMELRAGATQGSRTVIIAAPGSGIGLNAILVSNGSGWAKTRLPAVDGVAPRDISLRAVMATPDGGFAIVGDYFSNDWHGVLFTSPDGLAWAVDPAGLAGPRHAAPRAFDASSGPGIAIALGFVGTAGNGDQMQGAWWTTDGQRWQPSVLSLTPDGSEIDDVAQLASGDLIGVGIEPTIWRGTMVAGGPPSGPDSDGLPVSVTPSARLDQVAYLLSHAPDLTKCTILSKGEVTSRHPEATAGIECAHVGTLPLVRYYLFPNRKAMATWWSRTLGDAGTTGLPRDGGSFDGCAAGSVGETGWTAGTDGGRVSCYLETGTGSQAGKQFANVRWTDDSQLIGAWALGANDDLATLFAGFAEGRTQR
jgi:hypothetical protein